jgi:hypothetical protein
MRNVTLELVARIFASSNKRVKVENGRWHERELLLI